MLSQWANTGGSGVGGRPTLLFPFAANQDLKNAVDPTLVLTATRASPQTYFDSTGTLQQMGYNLCVQSQTFDNASWTKTNSSVTADAVSAPDGTTTADKVTEAADVNLVHAVVSANITVTSTGTYATSFYVKAAERTRCRVAYIVAAGGWTVDANLSTGLAIGTPGGFGGGSLTSYAITSVGNSWYRISGIGSGPAGTTANIRVELLDSSSNRQYNGDGTSGLYVWGAQCEEGTYLSTYSATTTAANGGMAYDYNPTTLAALGLSLWEARTNSIRNNTMVGASAGTPGTMPTNWPAVQIVTSTGISSSVVGTGTENGITYIELRVFGTVATGSGSAQIKFETQNAIAALNAQVWAASTYWRMTAGTLTGLANFRLFINENSAVPAFLQQDLGSVQTSPTSAALSTQRVSSVITLSNASTAWITPAIQFDLANGAAVDITLRIGLPQCEQGAFATPVIQTTAAAATRSAPSVSTTSLGWYNATEGTFVAVSTLGQTTAQNEALFDLNDNSTNNRVVLRAQVSGSGTQVTIRSGGATSAALTSAVAVTATQRKTAVVYKVNDFAICVNGEAPVAGGAGAVPVSPTQLLVGYEQGPLGWLNGWIQSIAYYPRRLANGTLQALST